MEICIVYKIASNIHLGNIYIEIDNEGIEQIFLFGKVVDNINPGLKINIGDKIELIKDENNFTTGIRIM